MARRRRGAAHRCSDALADRIAHRCTVELAHAFPVARAYAVANLDPALIDVALEVATEEPDRFMWPWEAVGHSVASGILDDVTYDWMTVIEPMLWMGGWPVVVSESMIVRGHEMGTSHTGIDASPTGTAGMAGLLDPELRASIGEDETVVVLFTGVQR